MNTTGRLFRLGITGTSRGPGLGAWIEGVPAGLPLALRDFEPDLARRRPGRPGTTSRVEPDPLQILSGVHEGYSTGQPLLIWIGNRDAKDDGHDTARLPRPGHADLVALQRYGGFADPRGGGAFSGRLTAALVVGGVVARKLLPKLSIQARVDSAGGRADIDAAVAEARAAGDSLGAMLSCRIDGVPPGWGEPLMDRLDARLAQICLSIPGVRSFELGLGHALADMRGSQANDAILDPSGRTSSNNAGGVSGGLSNGNPILFRVAARPTPSIPLPQDTVDLGSGLPATIRMGGRHDTCFALRLPVVLEAAAAIVLADFALLAQAMSPVDQP
jgi:chorismate synthase